MILSTLCFFLLFRRRLLLFIASLARASCAGRLSRSGRRMDAQTRVQRYVFDTTGIVYLLRQSEYNTRKSRSTSSSIDSHNCRQISRVFLFLSLAQTGKPVSSNQGLLGESSRCPRRGNKKRKRNRVIIIITTIIAKVHS